LTICFFNQNDIVLIYKKPGLTQVTRSKPDDPGKTCDSGLGPSLKTLGMLRGRALLCATMFYKRKKIYNSGYKPQLNKLILF
jgi:hypothetical protein